MRPVVWVVAVTVVMFFAAAPWLVGEVIKSGDTAVKSEEPMHHGWMHIDMVAHIDKIVGGLTPDQKAKIGELDKVRGEKVKAAFKDFHDGVVGVLTPEQKDKYEAYHKEMKAKGECVKPESKVDVKIEVK